MKTTTILLNFLRVSTGALYYLLMAVTVVFLAVSLAAIYSNSRSDSGELGYKVQRLAGIESTTLISYSADRLFNYRPFEQSYLVKVKPDSAPGYYALVSKLVSMLLGIVLLGNFRAIFRQTRLESPFQTTVTRRLKTVAIVFVALDILELIDYLVMNRFFERSVSALDFRLSTTVGGGVLTGMIVWVIAMIYQRGIELQQENALTI